MSDFITPQVSEIALSYMEGLACPRSLSIAILIRYREWVQLLDLECIPGHYCDAQDYFRSASATGFLRKLESEVDGLDPDEATLRKWEEAESQCFLTNRRLFEIIDFGTLYGLPVDDWLSNFISDARKNLLSLIGYGPDPCFNGKFGPGATMSDPAKRTSVLHKMSSKLTLTSRAHPYLVPWSGTRWAKAYSLVWDDVDRVRGNSYFTVPKTAKIRRPCAKEPSLNGYYQLGLGRQLRSRLESAGFNLTTGKSDHMNIARISSRDNSMATIDLSSASDTVCKALVKLLLPDGWYNHLADLRSPMTQVNGKWRVLEKFSSMGNGFTFELETAIFAAISMTAAPGVIPGYSVFVYGDDIIVPTENAQDVIKSLEFFGFTTNVQKTFTDGLFKESCGGDYFDGYAVRPHFLKELPYEPQHYISLANGIRRVMLQLAEVGADNSALRRAWFKCLDNIPVHIRACRGPEAYGDLVIHDDESKWITRWRANHIRYLRVYRPVGAQKALMCRFDPEIQYAFALLPCDHGEVESGFPDPIPPRLTPSKPRKGWHDGYDGRGIPLRDSVLGYKVGWSPYS